MVQQVIGIGAAPNDGLGDPLRTGGSKINANFTELYGDLVNAPQLDRWVILAQLVPPVLDERLLVRQDWTYSTINPDPNVGVISAFWGVNLAGGGVRPNLNLGGAAFVIEARFWLNGVGPMVDEFHVLGVTADNVSWRALTGIKPELAGLADFTNDANASLSERFTFSRSQLTDGAVRLDMRWSPTGGVVEVQSGVFVDFVTPGGSAPIMKQKLNLAAGFRPLPSLNALDDLFYSGRVFVENPEAVSAAAPSVFYSTSGLVASGAEVYRWSYGNSVDNVLFFFGGSATNANILQSVNTGTGAARHAMMECQSQLGTGGNAFFVCTNLVVGWSFGLHNGLNDDWVLAQEYRGLNSNFALRVDRVTLATRFGGSVGLPSNTVAELGAIAATAGDMRFCSNEAGGSVPAFGDGTNWRRVTDRAIVS